GSSACASAWSSWTAVSRSTPLRNAAPWCGPACRPSPCPPLARSRLGLRHHDVDGEPVRLLLELLVVQRQIRSEAAPRDLARRPPERVVGDSRALATADLGAQVAGSGAREQEAAEHGAEGRRLHRRAEA